MFISKISLEDVGAHSYTTLHPARLNILFGQNGSGKSTLLDAIESVLSMESLARVTRLSRSRDSESEAQIVLNVEDTAGHSLMTRLLTSFVTGEPSLQFDFSSDGHLYSKLRDAPDIEELLDAIAVGEVEQQVSEVREFVRPLLSELSLVMHSDWHGTHFEVWGSTERRKLFKVARQIEFGNLAHPLREFGPARFDVEAFCSSEENATRSNIITIPLLVLGYFGGGKAPRQLDRNLDAVIRDEVEGSIPKAVRLDDNLEDFEANLEAQISMLMFRLEGDNPYVESSRGEYFDEPGGDILGRYVRSPDGWLIDDRGGLASDFQSYSFFSDRYHEGLTTADTHYSINPYVFRAVSLIEARTNENLPSFISEQLSITFVVLPPGHWVISAPRVRVYARQIGAESIPMDLVGSGIRKWSLLAIRLACTELLGGKLVGRAGGFGLNIPHVDGSMSPEDQLSEIFTTNSETYEAAITKPEDVSLDPDSSQIVLLIDEPEAHLHPNAVRSVAQWIDKQSVRCMHVLVATHHPVILNLRGENVRHLLASKAEGESRLLEWEPSTEDLTYEMAKSIGTTVADLFLLSSYILFVEGPHDVLMLNGLFGALLSDYGIRVIPMHGIKGVHTLAAEEVIWALGIPIGVMADNVRPGEKSAESKQLEKLRYEASLHRRNVDEWHLPEKDVLRYIPDDIMRGSGNGRFPGWENIDKSYAEYVASCKRKVPDSEKQWMSKKYELDLMDRKFVENLITRMTLSPPPDLVNLVAQLISKARPVSADNV